MYLSPFLPRVEFVDAVFHVSARGNERKPIFRDDADRVQVLQTIEKVVRRFGVEIREIALLSNHSSIIHSKETRQRQASKQLMLSKLYRR